MCGFNASASSHSSVLLNDTLNPGPPRLPDLLKLLLRFRKFPAAVQADIRKTDLDFERLYTFVQVDFFRDETDS